MKNNKNMIIGIVVVVVVVIGALLVISMSDKSSTPTTTTAAVDTSSAVATTTVNISDYMFSPMVIKVKVGQTVTWTNKDSVHHSVTADTLTADAPNGPLIGQNQTYSFTFKKAGTYSFHCTPHPYMHGTVVVSS
jgi:amicyanin